VTSRVVPPTLAMVVGCAGCTLLLQREPGQCSSHADCQALGSGYICASDRTCVPFDVQRVAADSRDGGSCREDADCVALGLAVCRAGACLPLNAPEHGCVSSRLGTTAPVDGSTALLIGLIAKRDALNPSLLDRRLVLPVTTALNELNRARDGGPSALPALVGVTCDLSSPTALEYLVEDLQVGILLGPTDVSSVEPLMNQLGERAVLWAPLADGPNLDAAAGSTPAWLVSCKPNRSEVRPYFLSAITEVEALARASLETISPVVAVGGDVATTDFFAGFNASALDAAGLRAVSYTPSPRGRGLVRALEGMTPYPNLIIAASAEDAWGENMAALDLSSHETTSAYPYYLLAEKQADAYAQTINDQATADGFLPRYRRFMGLDYHRSGPSTLARTDFQVAHRDETASDPDPGFEYAYDCTYLAVYSALAAAARYSIPIAELPPEALMSSTSALMGDGPLLPVGGATAAQVIESIRSNRGGAGSVNLIGASGDLELLSGTARSPYGVPRYLAPHNPDGELYCIDDNTKSFCDTGITFSASDGTVQRPDATRCSCFSGAP
jgi:hypothetical protein